MQQAPFISDLHTLCHALVSAGVNCSRVRITSVRLGEQGPEEGVGVGAGACRLRPAGGETVAILRNISYLSASSPRSSGSSQQPCMDATATLPVQRIQQVTLR